MYCTKCGHKIMEGAAFCPSCGTPVASNTEATYEYEYTYVDNPLPWVAKLAHLYTISSPMAY
ncbi:MAG: zinc ribbon domain-containing protein [Atopobiaceae bacterium]|nr:zinc ribbon domain-containing protein [Atopobiaceae bacterium]